MTAAPARTIAQVSFSMRPPENLAAVYPDTSGLRKLRRRTMRSFKSRSGDEGIFRFCYSPDRKKGRMPRCRFSFLALLLVPLTSFLASFALPGTYAQERLPTQREIYLYQGADRAQRLISQARKEGGLSLYTTMTPEDATPMIAAFEEKYGIKVRMWRGLNPKLLHRRLPAAAAGTSAGD